MIWIVGTMIVMVVSFLCIYAITNRQRKEDKTPIDDEERNRRRERFIDIMHDYGVIDETTRMYLRQQFNKY